MLNLLQSIISKTLLLGALLPACGSSTRDYEEKRIADNIRGSNPSLISF